jgi:hypothetical protein
VINEFNSATEASKFFSINRNSIIRGCKRESSYFKKKFGLEVKFKEDFEELIKQIKTEP